MNKLKKYSFSDLYSISSGITTTKDQAGHGSPFLSFSTVFNNYFLPDVLSEKMYTSEKEQETFSIREGDIFLTRTSEVIDELAMSSIAIKNYPYATYSGFLKRLRPKVNNIVYPKYMAFYLRSYIFRKTINNNAVMTLRASFNEDIFSYLNVYLPDYEEQVKIGDLLFLLYEKISVNKKIIENLEVISKTIYDYWFVQFNFPNADTKPYKSDMGKMVYNSILKRNVPEDWQVDTLWNIADFLNGLPMQKFRPAPHEASLPVVKIREMNNGIDNDSERASINIPKKALIKNGDLLFSWSATLDLKIWSGGDAALNQHIFKVLPKQKYLNAKSYVYFELLNYLNHFKMIANLRKTTMGHITTEHLKQAHILVPPSSLIESFEKKIESNFQMQQKLNIENLKIQELMNWLVPLLINGQISIRDAEESIAKTFEQNG
ncbi:restriction endonuclease subunit S [Acinetobacter radioresistens]|uniref:restriction endonuclease subunit S n=1 Tax=Acinetobacter radioresistens TaxID=40216 RepID=UPI000C32D767|nr:restriction endonuclease subunit S [Acinetobacter radioresistens]PKH30227.1 hypothetical protein BJF94_11410 [Acinetobacter radioresistens]